MKQYQFATLIMAALLSVSVIVPPVNAQGVPVADTQSTMNSIKDFFQRVKESKFVMDTVAFANKTTAAVGDAKKSVTEYVVKNKEKIEKKVEKAENYKKQAEEYKKEYEEYRKWADESIEQAKDLKEQAEAGIETAKETASAAGSMAGAVKGVAQNKIDNVAAKAGVDTSDSGGSKPSEESRETSVATSTQPTADTPEAAPGAVANPVLAPAAQSSRLPFASPASSDTVINLPETTAELAPQTTAAPTESSMTGTSDFEAVVPVATTTAPLPTTAIETQPVISGVDESATISNQNKATLPQTKKSTRRSFTNTQKNSTLDLPGAAAVITGRLPVAFAFALSLPDDGTDVNGNFIVSPTINKTCGLSSSKALAPGVMDDCLVKQINDKMAGEQAAQVQNMRATYLQGKKEYAAAYVAEAFKAQNDTETYIEKNVDPILFATTTSTTDDYANLVELNKAVVTTLNGLLKVYSSRLALQAYSNYGDYQFSTPVDTE